IVVAVRVVYAVRGTHVTGGERVRENDLTAGDGSDRPWQVESVRTVPHVVRDERNVERARLLVIMNRVHLIAETAVPEIPHIAGGVRAMVVCEQGLSGCH